MNSQINGRKRFRIHTLGCKVNQYESQAMRELLIKAGFEESGSGDIADVYVVNTCTVTGEADRESKSVMGRFHRANPNARIVVTGCLAERDSQDISSMPGISRVLKNSDKSKIACAAGGTEEDIRNEPPEELSVSGFKGHSKAYVKIQDGCENRCSYCKVPLVRSRLKSKAIEKIVREVEGLVRNGFKEIILTGICLGAWGKELHSERSANLVDVLKALEAIDGDFRIRLSSIEPKYVTDELIDFVVKSNRICAHLHIPFQSGDDDILKLMNRPYTSPEYLAIVKRVRARIPRIAITTDILIGFPGESHENFTNTMAFVKAVAPSRTHIFTFSGREGTPAYDMPDRLSPQVLKERYLSISAVALEAARMYKRSFLEKRLNVLAEAGRDNATGLLKGYSDNYIQVFFAGPDSLIGNVVPVKITEFDSEKVMGTYGE